MTNTETSNPTTDQVTVEMTLMFKATAAALKGWDADGGTQSGLCKLLGQAEELDATEINIFDSDDEGDYRSFYNWLGAIRRGS